MHTPFWRVLARPVGSIGLLAITGRARIIAGLSGFLTLI
jgi:hypothetical protein